MLDEFDRQQDEIEDHDRALRDRDRRIRDLETRLRRIEGSGASRWQNGGSYGYDDRHY